MGVTAEPLVPYDRREALTLTQAVEIAGCSKSTLRNWCTAYRIGRHVCGHWRVSHPALLMLLDADRASLEAYLNGERGGEVAVYFDRAGVAVPAQPATMSS